MTNEEVRQQVERTDAFIAEFRELITTIALDPDLSVAPPVVHGLRRIADTVDAVDYVVFCRGYLANVNEAMRGNLAGRARSEADVASRPRSGPGLCRCLGIPRRAARADLQPVEKATPALGGSPMRRR